MIPTRSQIRSTSVRTWVEKMTVALPRRSAMRLSRSRRPSGSSELTGSSRSSSRGRATSAWAIPSRWRMPPEYAAIRRRAASVRPTSPSVSVARARASTAARPCSRPASSTSSLPGHPAVVARILVEDADAVAVAGPVRGDRPAVDRGTARRSAARGRSGAAASSSCRRRWVPAARRPTRPARRDRARPRRARPPGPPNRLVRPRHSTTAGEAARSRLATPDGQVQERAEQADERR